VHVAQLWVYPVKSLAGQRLERTRIGRDGIPGDRRVQVRDARDQLVTARTRHALLGLRATLDERGQALVEGHAWRTPQAHARIVAAAGEGARPVAVDGPARFDDTPLLIATDGAAAALGIDQRRLRPNILIGGVEGLAERDWPGRRLRVGEAVLAVEKLCKRCVMTTIDPETLTVAPDVLAAINARYEQRFALNCHVAREGAVAVGDPVELLA
jgi:MOSC domain-containing protein